MVFGWDVGINEVVWCLVGIHEVETNEICTGYGNFLQLSLIALVPLAIQPRDQIHEKECFILLFTHFPCKLHHKSVHSLAS